MAAAGGGVGCGQPAPPVRFGPATISRHIGGGGYLSSLKREPPPWTSRQYFVDAAAAAEKASGGKPGGAISQLMSLAAVAGEVRPHLDSAKSLGASAKNTLNAKIAAMMPHRNRLYGNVEDASYGVNKREQQGPDVGQIRTCVGTIDTWKKQADTDNMSLNRAESAVGV